MSQPMLTLNGRVINVFTSPKGVNKETGEEYGGTPKIQLMCESTLKNGSSKMELVDLNVPDATKFEDNDDVSIPVGVYINGNQAKFYALK
jgi:hypothetical protein